MAFGSANIPGVSAPDFKAHTDNRNNPHTVTKEQVGLGNVDNTADINKPVSTAVQTALNGKAAVSHTHAATGITQDASHRFVTDSEKTVWNLKSNPNLLDNWYFADPINQRGVTSLTTTPNVWIPAVDRFWFQHNSNSASSFTVNNGYVTITGTNHDGICQAYTPQRLSVGHTYTCSILTPEGALYTGSGIYHGASDQSWINVGQNLAVVIQDARIWIPLIVDASAVKTVNILAVKLEEGTQQTLARQEGGKWILNDAPPNPEQELAKCQRYYTVSHVSQFFSGAFWDTKNACFLISTPVAMQTQPSVGVLNRGVIAAQNRRIDATNAVVQVLSYDGLGIKVNVTLPNAIDFTDTPCTLMDWMFEFSAELR